MTSHRSKTAEERSLWARPPWQMLLLVGAVGLVTVSMVGYGFHKGVRMNAVYAPLVDAVMEIKLEATTAHLWFEEIVSGDRHEDVARVWTHLDQAEWYARAMLEGGGNAEGTFIPLDDAEMRREIQAVQQKLAELREISRQRLAVKQTSGPGSDIDQRYDAVFAGFIDQADELEATLQQIMVRDLQSFRSTQIVLIVSCLFLFTGVGAAFHRFERRRTAAARAIQDANKSLAAEIADRKRAEAELRTTEERVSAAQRVAHMGLWDWNIVTNGLYWSDEIYRIFGLRPQEFGATYDAFLASVHPHDRTHVQTHVDAAVQDGAAYSIDHRIVLPDGQVRHVHEQGEVTRDEGGTPIRMLGTVVDITDRKLAAQALGKANRALKALSECNQVLVRATEESELLAQVCRIIVEIGRYRLAWVGFAEHDDAKTVRPVARWGFEEGYLETTRITWADTECGRGPTGRAIRSGAPCAAQHILTDPGYEPWRAEAIKRGYSSSIALPLRSDGSTFGALNVYASEPDSFDATEVELLMELADDLAFGITALRTRAERERAEEALKKSEHHLRNVLDGLGPYMFVGLMTLDGKLIEANRPALDMAGLKPEDVLGRFFEETYWWSYSKPVKQQLREAIRRAVQGETSRYDVAVRAAENRFITIDFCLQPLLDEAGKIIYLIPSATDITERKRAEEALREAHNLLETRVRQRTAELQAANEELESFTYSVSHDLRAPLRHIDGYARMLLDDYADVLKGEARRYLETVQGSARKMGALIDDLLTLSRLGRRAVNRERVDCELLVRQVWAEISQRGCAERVVFDLQPLPPAEADAALLRHVWANLLENAVKYASIRETPRILVSSTGAGRRSWYRVQDNGVGFDQRYADKLFGVFQRLHRDEDFPGTGVGLAIVQRIVHKHGGTVRGFGKVDEGATFEFTLGD